MEDEAVGNQFQAHFNGENSCEKVIKIVQDLQKRKGGKQMVIMFENLETFTQLPNL